MPLREKTFSFLKNIPAETADNININVQTKLITQPGGVIAGKFRVLYQSKEEAVNFPPIKAVNMAIKKDIIKGIMLYLSQKG